MDSSSRLPEAIKGSRVKIEFKVSAPRVKSWLDTGDKALETPESNNKKKSPGTTRRTRRSYSRCGM